MGIAPDSTPSRPLVSVIVRTIGRDTLARTIQSVERQTWRPIEIVLVLARKMAAPEIRSTVPIVVVGGEAQRLRSPAANLGLESARGEWMMFLDEDDLVEPGHIESLLAAAEAAGKPVAYSQTRLVERTGATKGLMGGPFNREFLRRSNYLAIHAVLFHRLFVEAGARFDASFDIFEDWDFWLQLMQHTDFAFAKEPTAIYHLDMGVSGGGGGANLDREKALRTRAQLVAKWSAR